MLALSPKPTQPTAKKVSEAGTILREKAVSKMGAVNTVCWVCDAAATGGKDFVVRQRVFLTGTAPQVSDGSIARGLCSLPETFWGHKFAAEVTFTPKKPLWVCSVSRVHFFFCNGSLRHTIPESILNPKTSKKWTISIKYHLVASPSTQRSSSVRQLRTNSKSIVDNGASKERPCLRCPLQGWEVL